MNFLRTVLFIVAIIMPVDVLVAQSVLSTKNKKAIEMYVEADNYRVRGYPTEAINLLSQAIEKDKNFFEAYLRMGLTYKALKDFKRANEYLEKGVFLTREVRWQKVFWSELAENHLSKGDYEKVIPYAEQYLENETINKARISQVQLWKQCAEFSLEHINTKIQFQPRALSDSVNRFALQYFPVLTADEHELIFTRRKGLKDEFDEDLVIALKDNNGNWLPPHSISDKINTRFNEGTCTISADGRQLIFTSCYGPSGNCDLFESRKIGDLWTIPKNLGPQINSAAWESQPSLSADGRILYFVSERRGGLGRKDIYVSFKHDANVWTRAQNLGPAINTVYDEYSPFVHANSRTLFFASDGRPGFGGYDIYWSDWADSTWSKPVNFGYPINDHEDQFSLVITANGERGYYSHEESNLQSSSKIFEFSVPEEYRVNYRCNTVKGIVRDKATRQPLQAEIELYNLEKNDLVSFVNSDSVSGIYLMVLTQGADYGLYVNAPGYLFKSLNFNYEAEVNLQPLVIDVELEKASAGASIVLSNIFFDLDKYDLRDKSKTELDKMAGFLVDHPTMKVEISGHTDNQGSDNYNLQLSQKRAQAVSSYLIRKGLASSRFTQIGWGSKRPLRANDSEENRQINRRIEFKIVN